MRIHIAIYRFVRTVQHNICLYATALHVRNVYFSMQRDIIKNYVIDARRRFIRVWILRPQRDKCKKQKIYNVRWL